MFVRLFAQCFRAFITLKHVRLETLERLIKPIVPVIIRALVQWLVLRPDPQ